MEKVIKGQLFKPSADAWNSFIDAAEFVKKQKGITSAASRSDTKSGVVLVANLADRVLSQFEAVSLGSPVVLPSDNEDEFCNSAPVFKVDVITAENKNKPFAVLQVPLKQSEIGAAILTGITPLKLDVTSETHEFAVPGVDSFVSSEKGTARILWKESGTGNKWAVVNLGSATAAGAYEGPFAVVKYTESTVRVYSYNADEGRAFEALMILGLTKIAVPETEVEVYSGHVWIEVTHNGTDYIYEIKSGALPDQTNDKLIIPLADIGVEEGAITKIIQLQYGNIHFPGRVF